MTDPSMISPIIHHRTPLTLSMEFERSNILAHLPTPDGRRKLRHGKPKAMIFDPTATATYCLLSKTYVMGEAFHKSFTGKRHNRLPVLASTAANQPPSSPKKTTPPAVESTPPQESPGPDSGSSHAILPV